MFVVSGTSSPSFVCVRSSAFWLLVHDSNENSGMLKGGLQFRALRTIYIPSASCSWEVTETKPSWAVPSPLASSRRNIYLADGQMSLGSRR